MEDTYDDDIQWGGTEIDAATSIKIFSGGGFTSHKWHSNVDNLNSKKQACEGETYTKSAVGHMGNRTTKILGTPLDKQCDTLRVDFESCLTAAKP